MSDSKREHDLEVWLDTHTGYILDEGSEAISDLRKIFRDSNNVHEQSQQIMPTCPQCGGIFVSNPRLGIGHICETNTL